MPATYEEYLKETHQEDSWKAYKFWKIYCCGAAKTRKNIYDMYRQYVPISK